MIETIQTDRLTIIPFNLKHLKDYYDGFDTEITKYQYPDPFKSEANAQEMLQIFIDLMNQEEMLFLSVFTNDRSVEVHGLKEEQPELGIWIKKEFQKKGYAYEALSSVIKMVNENFQKEWYVYEADIRNEGSIKLVEKFYCRKEGLDEFVTETGKELKLQKFIIKLN